MKISIFSEKYNISSDTLMSRRSQGTIPKSAFYKDTVTHIKESYFTRRWEIIRRIQLDNQDLYYLITEHFSTLELCRAIQKRYGGSVGSYSVYFQKSLFSQEGDTRITIGVIAWRVYKYFRAINNRLKRRGASIEKILDKRMEMAA